MIDLNKLEAEREAATIDKADLFDFYHDNWDALVAAIRSLRCQFCEKASEGEMVCDNCFSENVDGG